MMSLYSSHTRQAHLVWAFKSLQSPEKQVMTEKQFNEPLKLFCDPGETWVNDGAIVPGILTCSGSSLLVQTPRGSGSSGVQLNCQSWWTWRHTFCTRKSVVCGLCVGRPSCDAYIHRRTWMWRYISGTGNSVYLRASADASLGSRPVWTFSHSGHTGKA